MDVIAQNSHRGTNGSRTGPQIAHHAGHFCGSWQVGFTRHHCSFHHNVSGPSRTEVCSALVNLNFPAIRSKQSMNQKWRWYPNSRTLDLHGVRLLSCTVWGVKLAEDQNIDREAKLEVEISSLLKLRSCQARNIPRCRIVSVQSFTLGLTTSNVIDQ
jgi:hypothetical protein